MTAELIKIKFLMTHTPPLHVFDPKLQKSVLLNSKYRQLLNISLVAKYNQVNFASNAINMNMFPFPTVTILFFPFGLFLISKY